MSLFLSYSFEIETKNTFIHSHSSLENYTRFQTKISKMHNRFLTEKALPFGTAHTYMAYIRKYPLPPGGGTLCHDSISLCKKIKGCQQK